MAVEDITLRDIDSDKHNHPAQIDKVLRLRVVKDSEGKLNGDKLFVDIMHVYEDFEQQLLTHIGSAVEYHEEKDCGDENCTAVHACEEVDGTTEEKMIGNFTFNLDDVIAALQLLKGHGY